MAKEATLIKMDSDLKEQAEHMFDTKEVWRYCWILILHCGLLLTVESCRNRQNRWSSLKTTGYNTVLLHCGKWLLSTILSRNKCPYQKKRLTGYVRRQDFTGTGKMWKDEISYTWFSDSVLWGKLCDIYVNMAFGSVFCWQWMKDLQLPAREPVKNMG